MMWNKGVLLGALFMLLLSSCEKEELPKPINGTQGAVFQTLEMGDNYASHIGFSLQSEEVSQIESIDWDIFIYPDKKIRINTSRFMKVAQLENESDFSNELDDSVYKYDDFSLEYFDFKIEPDEGEESYYIIDLGRDIEGNVLYKIDCKLTVNDDQLSMQYRKHNEEVSWKTKAFELNSAIGKFYSFITEKEMINNLFVGPDFYCGGYITRFEEAGIDYLVRGVLLNESKNIELARLTDVDYDAITLSDVAGLGFTTHIDKIGYDWKAYDLDAGLYLVDQTKVYIVKYSNGLIYKMKFVDFYSVDGEKGSPTLSFELLE